MYNACINMWLFLCGICRLFIVTFCLQCTLNGIVKHDVLFSQFQQHGVIKELVNGDMHPHYIRPCVGSEGKGSRGERWSGGEGEEGRKGEEGKGMWRKGIRRCYHV